MSYSTPHVLKRINQTLSSIVSGLSSNPSKPLTISTSRRTRATRNFMNLSQCRGVTNCILVISFVQKLLMSNRTATNRELYYVFITHFRSQRECDAAIVDVCNMLGVERISLGLTASPKGWFCGNIEIFRKGTMATSRVNTSARIDGRSLSSIQGLPITREWIHRAAQIIHNAQRYKPGSTTFSASDSDDTGSFQSSPSCTRTRTGTGTGTGTPPRTRSSIASATNRFQYHLEANFAIRSDAHCIVVVEKDGVYTRLSEDRFFDIIPCILVTGKGFPDIATRALVFVLHNLLNIPVYGIADCNPYGLAVLQTYYRGGAKNEMEGGDRYNVPIQWIGLRPSQLESYSGLPSEVYQKLTELDFKKITSLSKEMNTDHRRVEELGKMKKNGWKAELESLHYLGMDFMCKWLSETILLEKEAENGNIIHT